MAKVIEIDEEDLARLFGALEYAIQTTTDGTLRSFLSQEMGAVQKHLQNEYHGAEVVGEITAVIDFLTGGSRHDRDTEVRPRRRARGPRLRDSDSLEEG